MVQKLRTSLALQPVATALFANSPFFEGAVNGHKSWRARIWRSLDDSRTGMLPWVFEDGMVSDWADHLTTVFPEARIKQFIEMRGADGGPWRRLCALPAFWVGVMYDQTALDAAWDLCKDWSAEQREALRVAASVDGLQAKVDGINMHDLAREVVAIADAGLKCWITTMVTGAGTSRRSTVILPTDIARKDKRQPVSIQSGFTRPIHPPV